MRNLLFVLLLLTAGCATPISSAVKIGIAADPVKARADLEEAISYANNVGDVTAAACYQAVHDDMLPPEGVSLTGDPVGAFGAHIRARTAVRSSREPVTERVHLACSPLIVDAQKLGLELGLKFGP